VIFKPSVRVSDKDDGKIQQILNAATVCFHYCGYRATVTSIYDGVRNAESLHLKYRAVDFRTRNMPLPDQFNIQELIASVLGEDFDVVLESDHLHVEYDPFRG